MKDPIYLDNNATTVIDPDVAAAMHECLLAGYANPASQHRAGQRARAVLEDARERIAGILNIDVSSPSADRLIFTSGGTEANNLAIRGLGKTSAKAGRFVLVSSIEHPSVLKSAKDLSPQDTVEIISTDTSGVVRLDDLEHRLRNAGHEVSVVSVMWGNNETGVVQPIDAIGGICRGVGIGSRSVLFHTDAVQAVGKTELNFQDSPADAMTVSAHKLHGPCGIGALAIKKGVKLSPLLFGGSQQLGLRPGTESVALAVGMAVAVEKWHSDLTDRMEKIRQLRDLFERLLKELLDDLQINGESVDRLPHTSNVSFLGVDRQALLMALDFAGIQCSTGSACESGSSKPSHVLVAMVLPDEVISSAIRFSLSATTTKAEILEAARLISKSVKGLRDRKSRSF
ncbi:MAG: cysteine desulfurase [Planctomycetales bacterium]|nr:cysteine desulfurase [Planctomycetales bacterium]